MFEIDRIEWARVWEYDGSDKVIAPTQKTSGSAGYDLPCVQPCIIAPGEMILVPTGWRVAIPFGFFGLIRDRSGIAVKNNLTVRAGVIDSDYRGEVKVLMVNEGEENQTISFNTRIAQLIILPCLHATSIEVHELGDTPRGENGFGSTGE